MKKNLSEKAIYLGMSLTICISSLKSLHISLEASPVEFNEASVNRLAELKAVSDVVVLSRCRMQLSLML